MCRLGSPEELPTGSCNTTGEERGSMLLTLLFSIAGKHFSCLPLQVLRFIQSSPWILPQIFQHISMVPAILLWNADPGTSAVLPDFQETEKVQIYFSFCYRSSLNCWTWRKQSPFLIYCASKINQQFFLTAARNPIASMKKYFYCVFSSPWPLNLSKQ